MEKEPCDYLELFKKLINNIMGDVRTRLIQDAKDEGLFVSMLTEPNSNSTSNMPC